MRALVLIASAVLAGCGTASFTLPEPGQPQKGRYEWISQGPVQQPRSHFDKAAVASPRVFRYGQFYYNLYSAFDGATWTTGLSGSLDGRDWNLGRKVLAPGARLWEGERQAAFGAALERDGWIYYWFTAGSPPAIGFAKSADGRAWRREDKPVLTPGAEGAWDNAGAGNPALVAAGDHLFLYYLGVNAAGEAAVGIARSSDGLAWQKLRGNPVLRLASPGSLAVWSDRGQWWMLHPAEPRRMALASSLDGVRWNPLALRIEGEGAGVLVEGGAVRVWTSDGAGELKWLPE